MMVLSVGLPGMFTDWGERVISALIERVHGPATTMLANALEDIAEAIVVTGMDHLVVGVRQPNARLRKALLASAKPMIVFLEDPTRSALHLIANHGYSVPAAVRTVSGCCVTLMDFRRMKNALIMSPGRDSGDLGAGIGKIATHLGMPLSEAELSDIVRDLTMADMTHAEDLTFAGLNGREQAMLSETLGTYADAFDGRELGKLIWPRELFGISDAPTEAATRDIDVAGRARCLVFGPYMQLFPGNWKARVVLGFSVETVGTRFMIDVATDAPISHTTITPDAAGVYEVIVDFALSESDRPIEVRVFNERAAFEGHIALGFVSLTPAPVLQAATIEQYLQERVQPVL